MGYPSTRRPPMNLYSPGTQLAVRDRIERDMEREVARALGRFLADAKAVALESLSPGAVVPFSPTVLADGWEACVREAAGAVVDVQTEPEEYAEVVAVLLDSSIPDTVYASVEAVLTRGRDAGWDRQRMGRELRAALDPHVGVTVDVPEEVTASLSTRGRTMGAVAAGVAVGVATLLAARRFQRRAREARVPRQRWVSRRDGRVRPTHVEADGQTVAAGELFIVGGYGMRFPGDPAGPPGERINCRCNLVAVR